MYTSSNDKILGSNLCRKLIIIEYQVNHAKKLEVGITYSSLLCYFTSVKK